jgi:hypothetical protein
MSRPLVLRGSTAEQSLWFHAVLAVIGGDVTTAEEEAVNWGLGVLAGGGVVEPTFTRGVWGKGREQLFEVTPVGAVEGGSDLVETLVCAVSCFTGEAKQAEQGKEQRDDGDIERRHGQYSLVINILLWLRIINTWEL